MIISILPLIVFIGLVRYILNRRMHGSTTNNNDVQHFTAISTKELCFEKRAIRKGISKNINGKENMAKTPKLKGTSAHITTELRTNTDIE